MKDLNAVIIAGGLGTRFKDISSSTPKCLAKICGVPVLNLQLDLLLQYGITNIYISSGHLADRIEEHIQKSERYRDTVKTIPDRWQAGSGGCIQFLPDLNTRMLVLFGDIILQVNLDPFIKFHIKKKSYATIALQKNHHPYESDFLEIDSDQKCVNIHCKPHKKYQLPNGFMIGGLFILEPCILRKSLNFSHKEADLVRDIISPEIKDKSSIYGYFTDEYMDDMGTPERFERINNEWKERDLNKNMIRDD